MTDDDDFIIAHGGAEQLNRTAAAFPTANQRYRSRCLPKPDTPAPITIIIIGRPHPLWTTGIMQKVIDKAKTTTP